jgi:alpha-glucosidase
MNQHGIALTLCMFAVAMSWAQTSWTIVSPSDKIKAVVQLTDLGGQADYPSGKVRLYYSVSSGGPSAYTEVIQQSPLGLVRSDRNFVDSLTFVSEGALRTIDSTYTMILGKRSECRNYCTEKVLTFKTSDGDLPIELVLRAYDDGFAFRYRFPGTNATPLTVTSEATGFRIPAGSVGWLLPYNTTADTYAPAYEDCWQRNVVAGAATGTSCKPNDGTWCMPALFRTPPGGWALVWETDVAPSYCNARLSAVSQLVYRITFPNANEAGGESVSGPATPSSALPWTMPWRLVITGPSPGTILESTLSTDLATPCALDDVSWIKPGRSSWSWWSANSSPTSYAALVPFVDLAAQMTWEYSCVDAGWNTMTGGTWQQLTAYAAGKNVGVTLWYNSGGPINKITGYGPRDRLYDSAARNTEFQTISSAGVKGVKMDFWLSDKQGMVKYYWDVFRDAAKYHLVVDPHGNTIPRGWQRTFPNCLTAEAVRGAEQYIWDASDPAKFPWQHTILPFTRNTVASMDWTPVTFSNISQPHQTTFGHELALSVIFESGIQHFADRVQGYQTSAISAAAQTFLKQVPVAWDDTKYVQGFPGSWVVLARRKGSDWYMAGIAGDTARTMTVSCSFLRESPASYHCLLIADGASAITFSESTDTLGSGDSLTVTVPLRGGWAAKFTDLYPAAVGRSWREGQRLVASDYSECMLCAGKPLAVPACFTIGKTDALVFDLQGTLLRKCRIRSRTVDIQKSFTLPQGVFLVRLAAVPER